MIVYRVADGKGWTKDTFAQVTTNMTGNAAQLGHISTLRVADSDTAFTNEDAVKSVRPEIEVVREVYTTKETMMVIEDV